MRVVWFVVFLVCYVVFLGVVGFLAGKQKEAAAHGHSGVLVELTITTLLIPASFFFVWLLSGFFDLQIMLYILAATIGGIGISLILGSIFAGALRTTKPRIAAASIENALEQPWWALFFTFLSTAGIVIYPFYMAWYVLWKSPQGTEIAFGVIKATFLCLSLSGFLGAIPLIIGVLASKNLDEESRSRVFVGQVGNMIPVGILAAIAFYAFELDTSFLDHWGVSLPAFTRHQSILLAAVAFLVFLVTGLIPYMIGVRRAEANRTEIHSSQTALLGDLQKLLMFPNPDSYASAINKYTDDIKEDIESFVASHPMVSRLLELEGHSDAEISEVDKMLADTYQRTASVDPRFKHLTFLQKLHEEVALVAGDLNGTANPSERSGMAARYAMVYSDRRQGLIEADRAERERRRPQLFALLSLGLGAIASALVTQLAKFLWDAMLASAG